LPITRTCGLENLRIAPKKSELVRISPHGSDRARAIYLARAPPSYLRTSWHSYSTIAQPLSRSHISAKKLGSATC
jgi:hypothetical protein